MNGMYLVPYVHHIESFISGALAGNMGLPLPESGEVSFGSCFSSFNV